MALTNPEKAVLGCLDRLAYLSHGAAALGAAGTTLWARVDASDNQVFEDRVKGSITTLADLATTNMEFGNMTVRAADGSEQNALSQWTALLNDYAVVDLGYASLAAWFAARKFRIDDAARKLLEARLGRGAIAAANVHAPADGGAASPGLLLGTFQRSVTYAAGSEISPTLYAESPILARVTAIGTADWTLSITFKLADGTTKTIAQVIVGSGTTGAADDTYVLGAQALGNTAAAGQKVVPVAATAQFKVGQKVLVTEWTGDPGAEVWTAQEVGTIASVQENASITMVDNLVHDYTAAGFAYPCGVGITACAGTGGTAGDTVVFAPAADRKMAP